MLDEDGAIDTANDFLARVGTRGTVSVSGDSVTVTVHLPTSMLILGAAGVGDKTVTGTGTAGTSEAWRKQRRRRGSRLALAPKRLLVRVT